MEWIKALHIISAISWMAGIFYLPRLFVYHCRAKAGSEMSETFKIMEARLLRAIMRPAMAATWVFGLTLVFYYRAVDWGSGWTWIKAIAVFAMSGVHVVLERHAHSFADDRNSRSERYFRVLNEVPTLLMIVIVVFVVVKPF